MQITVTTESGGVFPLEVSGELTVGDLKGLLEVETGTEPSKMLLIHNMAPMTDDQKTLNDFHVEADDIITVTQFTGPVTTSHPSPLAPPHPAQMSSQPPASGSAGQSGGAGLLPPIDWGTIHLPMESGGGGRGGSPATRGPQQQRQPAPNPDDPEAIRQHLLSNPYELSALRERNPGLADALLSGDAQRWREALEQQRAAVRDLEMQRIRMLNADPMDPAIQQRIAQDIQQRNIQENMETALEYTPETFTKVVMLYVMCKVNGVPVKALVDSGARSTVMSARCAERCNIMRLVDHRFAGVAFGVGRQKILGRVHLGQIQIGNDFLTSSFQVLEEAAEDMLLGLDMLRRHLCCIDLEKNVLRIGSTRNEAPFLTEKDLQEKEQMEKQQAALSMEDEDAEMAQAVARSEREYQQGAMDVSHQPPQGGGGGGGASLAGQSSAPAATPTPQQPEVTQPARHQFPEAHIERIIAAGFTQEEAIRELSECGGSVERALTSLLAKSIKF